MSKSESKGKKNSEWRNGRRRRVLKDYEVQRLKRGETSQGAFEKCPKNVKHDDYVSMENLSLEKQLDSDTDLYDFVVVRWNLTGLVILNSCDKSFYGTGFVQRVNRQKKKLCPCPKCNGEVEGPWATVAVSTAHHVVRDCKDVTKCKVRLFYDKETDDAEGSDTDDNPKYSHLEGLEIHSEDEEEDWCILECVTHDIDLIKKLQTWVDQHWELGKALKEKFEHYDKSQVIIISHPHGGPKLISIGKVVDRKIAKEVRDQQDWCYYSYDAMTCSGSSGAPVYVVGKWNSGFGFWFGHPHNHNGVDDSDYGNSSFGAESTWKKASKQSTI